MTYSSLTVLLAEDDENDVILIRRACERLSMIGRLVVVSDGEWLIPYLKGQDQYSDRETYPIPDVLILDRCMPRLSGLDVLFWLRTEPRFIDLPVLVLSNGFKPDEGEIVQRLNAVCTVKTVELAALPHALQEGIDEARRLATRDLVLPKR